MKKYTKKQITEAIAYWEKQLKDGNYKKLNEANTSAVYSQCEELANEFREEYSKFKAVIDNCINILMDQSDGTVEEEIVDMEDLQERVASAVLSDYFNQNKIYELTDDLRKIVNSIKLIASDNSISPKTKDCIKAGNDFLAYLDRFDQQVADMPVEF